MRPRSVVRDGERGVVRMDILGHVRGSPAWCEHLDLVPAPTQLAGEIANMVLHTARRLERVWQMMPTRSAFCCPAVPLFVCKDGVFLSNDGILASCSTRWTFHRDIVACARNSSGTSLRRSISRSSRNIGWSMCQSSGCAAMPLARCPPNPGRCSGLPPHEAWNGIAPHRSAHSLHIRIRMVCAPSGVVPR